MPRPDADLIIAGAGCAGMSALWHVLHSPARDRRIMVIDRSFEPVDDRTWAFWGAADAPFAHLADRSWDHVRVRFSDWETTGRLRGSNGTSPKDRRTYISNGTSPKDRRTYISNGTSPKDRRTYMRVRRRAYDQYVLELAASRPNVRFVAQDIVGIRDDADGGVVTLPEGELRAPLVLQSALLAPADRNAAVRHPLRQHFGGWEVRTEHPVFDPEVVTLMDFDTDQHDGTAFVYVLPEAPDRALVEHTMFSLRPHGREFHDDRVRAHLEHLGAGAVTVTRTEYGSIPMEDRPLHQRWGEHVWSIGTVGGMTKPSTGYTFQRIHAQTRHLVSTWVTDGRPSPLPSPPWRYNFADRALLDILHHHPEHGRPIFERLFRTTSIDDVLSFLDENTTLAADARMVARLPWSPFLRAGAVELGAGVATLVHRRRRP